MKQRIFIFLLFILVFISIFFARTNLSGVTRAQTGGSQQQSSFYPKNTPASASSTNNKASPSTTVPTFNLTYYPQCSGPYDKYPMEGCNICTAGCGPTSVAMILSSYLNNNFDPPTVVNLYKQNGLLETDCRGTTIIAAQQILNQNGIKTTDVLYYGDSSFDETVQDFRQYLKNGWTLLTLVKYSPTWAHFYWVINIDQNNNVWAYDPGNARRPVPLNENTVNPEPKYYLAIGVRKN